MQKGYSIRVPAKHWTIPREALPETQHGNEMIL